jgi:hypothetical protein
VFSQFQLLLLLNANLFIILILYVDGLFIIRNDKQGVANLKSQLMAYFCMIYLGLVWKYRGIEFKCTKCGLLLHQMSYVDNLLHEFHMIDSTSTYVPIHESTCLWCDTSTKTINATIYQCMVGNYNYLTKTLPNLQCTINIVNWHMHEPHSKHLHVVY